MIDVRLKALRKGMEEADLDAILVCNKANVRYLSNYSGDDAYLFISKGRAILITDFRFIEQAQMECIFYQIMDKNSPHPSLADLLNYLCTEQKINNLGFESAHTSFDSYELLKNKLSETTELIPIKGMIEEFRYVKDAEEIAAMHQACSATDKAFAAILEYIKPGISEKDLARELLNIILKMGYESSFPIIAASGVNGSMPHAIPTDKLLAENEFITLDFGCAHNGYHADMTRTVFLGKPDEGQKKVYEIVLDAKRKAQASIKTGVLCSEVDAAARDRIRESGYGECFGHGTGHGVGLDIHEMPALNGSSRRVLREGCIFTVEPGIYIPDWGGVRIEDTVILTDEGPISLFESTCELITIDV